MLQLAVTAHVEVANEVVLADSILLHGPIKLVRFPPLASIPISKRSVSGMLATAHPRSAAGNGLPSRMGWRHGRCTPHSYRPAAPPNLGSPEPRDTMARLCASCHPNNVLAFFISRHVLNALVNPTALQWP